MHCIRPIKAGYDRFGNITYNTKLASKELVGFQFECRKCLPCRLNVAKEKAVRCWHESKIHEDNIFLTLTYNDESLTSSKLQIAHFQKFVKDLRDRIGYAPEKKISLMYTGEYGEENKRPHWHAIIFNYKPSDEVYKYTTDRDEKVYTSEKIASIWNRGNIEYGSVTLESAGYVARYAAKKLVHGKDQDHDFHPIHKTSSANALGKRWIEEHYKYTFENGICNLPNGSACKIPRYYVDWAKKEKYEVWKHYVTEVRPIIIQKSIAKARKEEIEYLSQLLSYNGSAGYPLSRSKVKETILNSKFKQLQERLKL